MPDYEERIMDENENLRADYAKALDVIKGLRAELADARHKMAQADINLAAMTARKDGYRRVARMLHGDIHEALDNELYEYATDHYAWKRDWSCQRRIERREARNG